MFLLNDLSFEGQFQTRDAFASSARLIWSLKAEIERAGLRVMVNRGIFTRQITADGTMLAASQALGRTNRQRWLIWLNKEGPHWDLVRDCTDNEWLEVEGQTLDEVTDNAVGEAALRQTRGEVVTLLTVDPSSWARDPIEVVRHFGDGEPAVLPVVNTWNASTVSARLSQVRPRMKNWADLEARARVTCPGLLFADDAFEPLKPLSFQDSSAARFEVLFSVLQAMKDAVEADNHVERDWLYQTYCVGKRAPFSSQAEDDRLKFVDPTAGADSKKVHFCWHGKVNSSADPLRFHFSWPIKKGRPIAVVYIGQKLTKA